MSEKREYPVHVREIFISDPCVLASPDTGKYYIYARMFDPKKFPEVMPGGRKTVKLKNRENLVFSRGAA